MWPVGFRDKSPFHSQGEQKRASERKVIVPTGNWLVGLRDLVNMTLFLQCCFCCLRLHPCPSPAHSCSLCVNPELRHFGSSTYFPKVSLLWPGSRTGGREHRGGQSTGLRLTLYHEDKATSTQRNRGRPLWTGLINEGFLEEVRFQVGLKDVKAKDHGSGSEVRMGRG